MIDRKSKDVLENAFIFALIKLPSFVANQGKVIRFGS